MYRVAFLSLALALLAISARAQTTFFDNFDSGSASAWLHDQGTWAVETNYYHGVGVIVPGRVWNVSYVPTFGGADVSVQAEMHTDAGSDDVNKMMILRYVDPQNFLVVNFRAGGRHDAVVEQVVAGARSGLTPEGSIQIQEHGQLEWKNCRVDLVGQRIIIYFNGLEVADRTLPTIVVQSGSVGVATFASGGGNEEIFVDNFRASHCSFAVASSMALLKGAVLGGTVSSTWQSENQYLTIRPGLVFSMLQDPIDVTFSSASPFTSAGEFRLKLETAVSSSNINQRCEMYNNQNSSWELIFNGPGILSDFPYDNVLSGDLSRFVNSQSNEIKARLRYRATNVVFGFPWTAKIDKLLWTSYEN